MRSVRTLLLFISSLLIGFAAFISATRIVPHLREDMVEINVRPTLLSAVMVTMHFGTFALSAFAAIVFVEAIQSARTRVIARVPLLIVALLFISFGLAAFIWTGSNHTLGYVLMGSLLIIAAAIPEGGR